MHRRRRSIEGKNRRKKETEKKERDGYGDLDSRQNKKQWAFFVNLQIPGSRSKGWHQCVDMSV